MTHLILNLSVRGYLPLIRRDSVTHTHGLAVCVRKELSFAQDWSLEQPQNSIIYTFTWPHFIQHLTSVSSLCTAFEPISSITDEVLSINPSANVFLFGDFKAQHEDWITYFDGNDRPGKLSNKLTQLFNLLYQILTVISKSNSFGFI